MNQKDFLLICTLVIIVTLGYTITFQSNDFAALFMATLGAVSTCAAVVVAYRVYANYIATPDIQRLQFDLVNKALEEFTSIMFFTKVEENTYWTSFAKDKLDYLSGGLKISHQTKWKIYMSGEFLDRLLLFNTKINHFFFPKELKLKILPLIPQGLTDVRLHDLKDKIIFLTKPDQSSGLPMMKYLERESYIEAKEFIANAHEIRISLQKFLNDKLHSDFHIKDEE
jgi:hypothetical protein